MRYDPHMRKQNWRVHAACACLLTSALSAQIPAHATHVNSVTGFYKPLVAQTGDAVMLFGEYGGYSRSSNGGRTWQVVDQALAAWPADDVSVDGDRVVVVGQTGLNIADGPVVRVSDNGGQSWAPEVQVAAFADVVFDCEPRVYVDGDDVVVVWTQSGLGTLNMRRSTDGGATFPGPTVVLGQLSVGQGVPGPGQPKILADGQELVVFWFAWSQTGAVGQVQVSSDGGQTWLATPRTLPALVSSGTPELTGSPASLFALHMGTAMQHSTDGGATWTHVGGLFSSSLRGLAIDGQRMLAAFEEPTGFLMTQWTLQRSIDGGASWLAPVTQISGPSGFEAEAHIVGDDYYVSFTHPTQRSWDIVIQSSDQGATWRSLDTEVSLFVPGPRRNLHVRYEGLTFAPHLYAYTGLGWTPVGTGTPGTGGEIATLGLSGMPSLGEATSFEVANAVGGSLGVVAVSSEDPVVTIFAGGVLWLQSPVIPIAFPTNGAAGVGGAGSGSVSLNVPNDPSLVGSRLTAQALVLDAQAQLGLALTRGIEVWLR